MARWNVLTPRLAIRLAAPHTWPASVYPALFGELYCLLAGYEMTLAMAAALLCACILMQSSVNTLNDFFDYIKGVDSADDCVEASDAVLVYEHIKPAHALLLGLGYLAGAAVLALPILLTAGTAPFIVGAIGAIAVVFYSGGPLPISYLPVGEVISGFVMGGLIPLGILAAATGGFQWTVMAAALPFIVGIGLIMMTNNTCDIEKDLDARRRTLPTLLGRPRAVRLYRAAVLLWLLLLAVLPVLFWGWLGLLCLFMLVLFSRQAFRFLLQAPLNQARRVEQMKGILKANLLGNGAYLMALSVILLAGRAVHG